MKQFLKENPIITIIAITIIVAIIYTIYKKNKSESSYTRYNDTNFPGLVSKSNMPRDTGNPIADIQLIRMAEANPELARTIQS